MRAGYWHRRVSETGHGQLVLRDVRSRRSRRTADRGDVRRVMMIALRSLHDVVVTAVALRQ